MDKQGTPVTFRRQINAALQRTTGYRVTRETPEQRQEHIKKAADTAAQPKLRRVRPWGKRAW
jgi:hypothetical protein